jgi:hypothetical protein
VYTGCLYLLIDGDKVSEEVAPNKGLKQGCPLSPLLYSLYINDMDRFLTVQRGATTALDSVQIPHCDYADDIALTSNTAEILQLQLNKFYNYTRFKGLKLNTDKTKVMVFFSRSNSAIPPSRTTAHLWNLSQNSNALESLLLVMEACSQLLRRWQTNSGLPLPEFAELVTARVSSTESMQCYGFSRSLL